MKKSWKKKLLDMNSGLTKISVSQKNDKTLPKGTGVNPSSRVIESRLVKVLKVKNIGGDILEDLAPNYEENVAIKPAEYQKNLSAIINECESKLSSSKYDKEKQLYKDAVELLQKEVDQCQILDAFRLMLLQG